MAEITYDMIAEAFSYNPYTGAITRNMPTRQNAAGTVCTFLSNKGNYLAVSLKMPDGKWKQLGAHRVAFMLMKRRWPTNLIDHVDGSGTNNVWSNIREASVSDNMVNSKLTSRSSTGYKGVCVHKGRYIARVTKDGKQYHVGTFDCPNEAHKAYMKRAKELHKDFAFSG